MNRDRFWLTDAQFARAAPHLPRDTRGKPRVDDRQVISGIVHAPKSGGRWIDAPPDYGPSKTLYNRYVRWAATGLSRSLPCVGQRRWSAGPGAHRLLRREGAPLGLGRKRGERTQAIGRSRGGRTTKIHALTDRDCRPITILLTGGQVADCKAGAALLKQMPAARILHGDKGYDSNAIRRQVVENGTMPNIPPKANRRWKNCFSPVLCRGRNAIERMFCRLKDFRRVATRYDCNAVNFLAAVCIAATVNYWL